MSDSRSINFKFMRKFASDEVSAAMRLSGYREQTIAYVSDSLGELISRDAQLDSVQAKKIQNQLLVLLDAEDASQSIERGESDDENH